ncbi:hypothetical protein CG740_34515 [Streptomyces sp. CB01201]|nr:hypothetical protein CG740_34515 [Streptomyces sp. CB01201]
MALSARPVCLCQEAFHSSVGGSVREGGFPCGGTRSEVVARRAGRHGAIVARRPLSTGLVGRLVDDESSVSATQGGVRFGMYTCPMQTQKIMARTGSAPVGTVGR